MKAPAKRLLQPFLLLAISLPLACSNNRASREAKEASAAAVPATAPPASSAQGGTLPDRAEDLLVFTSSDPQAVIRIPSLPSGWEPYQFEKIPRQTAYRIVLDGGEPALEGRSECGASALRRRFAIDPAAMPTLEWFWKVEGSIREADLTRKERDDAVARVMILYRYDSAKVSLLERAKFESARAMHGEYPPHAMLVYAWASGAERDAIVTSPYSDRVKVVVIESGEARVGSWVAEKRNHLEDYRRAFGAEPPPIEAVALMVDTDNTCSEATAWFRSVRFER